MSASFKSIGGGRRARALKEPFTMKRFGSTVVAAVAVSLLVVSVSGCGDDDDPNGHGSLTDTRDGKTYRTVVMPNGKTWMAENLNYETASGNSWCYGDNPSNCDTYGRLYTWEAAMGGSSSSNTNPSGVQGVCPAGWHLPSDTEWTAMVNAVSSPPGTKLKSTSGWNSGGNGTDNFGFSALPGGGRNSDGSFNDVGNYGYWWSATENGATNAWRRYMLYDDGVGRYWNIKTNAFSVRCAMD